jgi:hypothetical protein
VPAPVDEDTVPRLLWVVSTLSVVFAVIFAEMAGNVGTASSAQKVSASNVENLLCIYKR